MKPFSIAIDGPAGAGKSTIAKQIAANLQAIYIDTGAMYRSVAYYCIKQNINIQDEEAVSSQLPFIDIKFKTVEKEQRIVLNNQDISTEIRTDKVAAAASKVATYKAIREALVKMQQLMAKSTSVVMDGRDIGTVVLPFATLKIFLTASVEERAQRRYLEYSEKGLQVSLEALKEEIEARDTQDTNRSISPLKKAEDAIEIDTTHRSIKEIVAQIEHYLQARL